MSYVYAFGSFDKPQFKATVDARLRAGHRNGGNDSTCWCCPWGKGHRTANAAAQHAARLMVEPWQDEPQRDEKGYPVTA